MPELSRYQARREAGLCTMCGTEEVESDRVRCGACRKHVTRAERVRREERVARGRCRTCGARPPEKGRRDCRPCLDRYAGYMRQRAKKP
jgi:uncharacterized CHY-type Zn-finger protein